MRQPYPWKHQLYATAPTILVILLALFVFQSERKLEVFFAVFRQDHPLLTWCVNFITDWGNPVLYTVYACLLIRGIARRENRLDYRFALSYAIALALTLSIVYLFKGTIGRARPYLEPEFRRNSWIDDYHSFPSGHTTEAIISAAPLAMRARRDGPALLLGVAAALVAGSRAYLGMHYLSDILGGIVMGSIGAGPTWWLYTGSLWRAKNAHKGE